MWQYNGTDVLYHYGVKGMKWGVRRSRSQLKFNNNSIVGSLNRRSLPIRTSVGVIVKSISNHALNRIGEGSDRRVTAKDIEDALTSPLFVGTIKTDKYGRRSQRYIGVNATVNVNPDSGVIPTVWITGTSRKNKYLKKVK